MKCPNCGAPMKEGTLYCEKCGEEIHIVPDFEPELDDDIRQTIKSIADDIWDKDSEAAIEKVSEDRKQPGTQVQKKRKQWVIVVALIIFFGAGAAAGIYACLHYSLRYQTNRARECVESGAYEKAIRYYKRAVEIDPGDVNLKVELAETYFLKNNKIEYEYLLREIVKDENATAEQVESAYGKLIAIYRARGDYQTINDFLLACGNESVMSTYQNYIAREPEFSVKSGYYTTIQPLKMSAFGTGKIYYTMDGSDPDEDSAQYTAPILLENGDYCIKAYYVSENGITSDIVTGEYHIEIEELPAPEISAISGDYEFPINIEVLNDDEEVYYTTDGTKPTIDSIRYTGPIPMPLGKSVFKFVRIGDGRNSEVEERTYQLTMNTEFTPGQAEEAVVDYCLSIGKITDEAGRFDDTDAMYKYQYQYVTNINQIDDFYVIDEILSSVDRTLIKTGSHFAVNAYTGELFKLLINDHGYTLVEIERPSEDQEE